MSAWAVLMAVGLGSYALRALMLLVASSRELPPAVESALALVAPAALGAMLASMLLAGGGVTEVAPWPELLAVGCGFVAVRRTDNLLAAFAVGLPVLWAASALAG